MIEIVKINTLKWQDLLSSFEDNVFCHHAFFDAVKKASSKSLSYYAIYFKDELFALFYYCGYSKFGIKFARTPLFMTYTGLLTKKDMHPSSYERRLFETQYKIANFLKHYNVVDIFMPLSEKDMRGFLWSGFDVKIYYTRILSLKNTDITYSARKQIKKFEKLGEFGKTTDFETVSNLVLQSYKRRKEKLPCDKAYIRNLIETISKYGLCDIFCARIGEKIHAVRAILKYRDKIYDWLAGSTDEGLKLGANSFLIHNIIEYYKDNYDILDFLGVNKPSISIFKSNFGGELKSYFGIHKRWLKF